MIKVSMAYLNPNNPGVRGRRAVRLEIVDGGVEAVGCHRRSRGGGEGSGLDGAEGRPRVATATIHRQGAELLSFLQKRKGRDCVSLRTERASLGCTSHS